MQKSVTAVFSQYRHKKMLVPVPSKEIKKCEFTLFRKFQKPKSITRKLQKPTNPTNPIWDSPLSKSQKIFMKFFACYTHLK